MDSLDLDAALKKIDRKFAENMTREDREVAAKQFRLLYAQQMSKLTSEVQKRQKIQENLTIINEKELIDAKNIDEQLRKKIMKHNQNRDKHNSMKKKQYKMQDDNWKRKLDQMMRRKRQAERDNYQRAKKYQKETEEYLTKKSQPSPAKEEQEGKKTMKRGESIANYSEERDDSVDGHYKVRNQLPSLNKYIKKVDKKMNNTLQQISSQQKFHPQVNTHRERSLKTNLEKEEENFQKIMWKLERIQEKRKTVQQRIEKQVEQSKKIREAKQNPEVIAANRKKYEHESKSRQKTIKYDSSKATLSANKSKNSLGDSIVKHLETKKKLAEQDFQIRQNIYQMKKQKLKHSKINRLVKEAINYIKHQTLNDKQ